MISKHVLSYLDNSILYDFENYFAILGRAPSKGARSPKLWNAVFSELNIPIRMLAFDCKPDKFHELFAALQDDKNFLGGAVTNP